MTPSVGVGLGSFALGWAAGAKHPDALSWPGLPESTTPSLPLSAFGLLAIAEALGYRRVQLADNIPVAALAATVWEQLREDARRRNLAVELGMRGLIEDGVRRYLALAEQVGSPFLRIVIDREGYEPTLDEIVRLLQRIEPRLAQARVVLAIENHDRFTAAQLAGILQRVDSPWVGICLDTANSLGAGEGLDTLVRVLAPWVINVHLKDFRVRRLPHQFGFVVEGVPLGTGLLREGSVREMIGSLPRCLSLTLEQWVPPATDARTTLAVEAAWCTASSETLRGWFPSAFAR